MEFVPLDYSRLVTTVKIILRYGTKISLEELGKFKLDLIFSSADLSKIGLKIYYFCQHSKKAKKWPDGQTILSLANSYKKAKWQP